MIRRHPHVFGDVDASNANEVAELWEQVKLAEQATAKKSASENGHASLLDGVPTNFPALLQAQKISRKAAAAGFEWETVDDVWLKVAEERAELEVAYEAAPKTPDGKVLADPADGRNHLVEAAEMEFGDLLFALVNVARKMGIDAEAALRASNAKFRTRFAKVEQGAWEQGRMVEDLTLDEMESLWQHAKEDE
jgi:tetrapyrrole methylase family protein/MazG family protein